MPPSSATMPLAPSNSPGAQAATHFRGFVHHRLEAYLHQFVGCHQTGYPCTDNCHFSAVVLHRNAARAFSVLDPVIEGEGKSGPNMVIGFLPLAG